MVHVFIRNKCYLHSDNDSERPAGEIDLFVGASVCLCENLLAQLTKTTFNNVRFP